MNVKKVISKLDFRISKERYLEVKKEAERFIGLIEQELKAQKINAETFIGGSFAKETILDSEECEVDLFLRFDWKYESPSEVLERIVKAISKREKIEYEKIHGSRDYFMVKRGKISFEIIPVIKIKKPKEAKNVMDLSYFHVRYVKDRIKRKKLGKDIVLAKKFFKAIGVYGAESYIRGFSGYGVECLVIAYGGFENMLKKISESEEKIVLDPEKHYKTRSNIMLEMNEARLNSPMVLVDPTYKERNVLAGLGEEKFEELKKKAKEFLKKPSEKYFEIERNIVKEMKEFSKKKKAEFLEIELSTDKQRGDIAGAKMKKYADYLTKQIGRYYDLLESNFEYGGKDKAFLRIVVKSKRELEVIGPPTNNKPACEAFRKAHKGAFVKRGFLRYKLKIEDSGKKFIEKMYNLQEAKKAKSMAIDEIKIIP